VTPAGAKSERVGKIKTNRKAESARLKSAPAELATGTEPAYIGPPSHIEILRRQKREGQ